jgi:glycerophosphoryl diester phosphodiesterase
MKTLIWGHRGASYIAPENTMESFRLAERMGADGIELDVHLTKNGHIVVAHDETIDRCSDGSGRIIDKTLSELRSYDFSNNREGYSGVRIPTLAEVLEFAAGTRMTVNIEIKSGIVIYEGIEEKTVKLVEDYRLSDRVIYSSFNHYSLVLIKKINPRAQTGILYTEAMVDPHLYAKHIGASAIHPYYPTLLVPGVVEGCKKNGVRIHTWTADRRDHLSWLFGAGVDAVITNRPDEALLTRAEIQE